MALADGAADNLALWSNTMRKRYFPNPVPDGFYTGNTTKDRFAGLLQDYYAWEWGDALAPPIGRAYRSRCPGASLMRSGRGCRQQDGDGLPLHPVPWVAILFCSLYRL